MKPLPTTYPELEIIDQLPLFIEYRVYNYQLRKDGSGKLRHGYNYSYRDIVSFICIYFIWHMFDVSFPPVWRFNLRLTPSAESHHGSPDLLSCFSLGGKPTNCYGVRFSVPGGWSSPKLTKICEQSRSESFPSSACRSNRAQASRSHSARACGRGLPHGTSSLSTKCTTC